MTSLVKIEQVSKKYKQKLALNQLNLEIEAGQIIGLLGPNGSGKTTLIKMLNGLLQPTSGQILIDGMAPCTATKAMVSYLPDTTYLPDNLQIEQVLAYFLDFYSDFDEARARHLLADLNIDTSARLKTLSKGNQEKVQLIMVMSRKARLYVLDEPIGGVDPAARDYILKTIINNYSSEASVIIATHLIADVEPILDQVIFINQGQLVRQGAVDDLRTEFGLSIDELFRQDFKA